MIEGRRACRPSERPAGQIGSLTSSKKAAKSGATLRRKHSYAVRTTLSGQVVSNTKLNAMRVTFGSVFVGAIAVETLYSVTQSMKWVIDQVGDCIGRRMRGATILKNGVAAASVAIDECRTSWSVQSFSKAMTQAMTGNGDRAALLAMVRHFPVARIRCLRRKQLEIELDGRDSSLIVQ